MEEEQPITNKEKYELRRHEKNAMRDSASKRAALKKTAIWVLTIGALTGSVFAIYNYGGSPGTTAMIVDAVSPTDHVFSAPGSKVTLIEYGDFQCPACAAYAPLVGQLLVDFPTGLRIVWRHFPLPWR